MSTYQKDQPATIQALFDSIAADYDRTNAIMSFQLHKRWNRELVRQVAKGDPSRILDLCCGTGDIAFEFLLKAQRGKEAVLVDFSQKMLECAKAKASRLPLQSHSLHYLQADVQDIPLPDQYTPCAVIAYGIRNVKDPSKCFREVYRVLQPGGAFGILELTRPSNFFLRIGHRLYLKTLLPLIGKWATRNQEAYQYLPSSINTFIPPQTLANQLEAAGFEVRSIKPLTGGIATLITASRVQ